MEIATLAGGPARNAIATLAGGCFWCMEAVFQRLKGVISVVSGYCQEAESIQITFYPHVISYEMLLNVFWRLHDPTTLNQQGNDVGTQYRSAIFYHDDEQKRIAQASKKKVAGAVTEIVPFTAFYPAEDYHQDYYKKNSSAPYCQYIIDPKITKLYNDYGTLVKNENSKI